MQTTKKKPFWPLIGMGAVAAIYLGYLVGAAWAPGRRFDEFMAVFSYVLDHPFANYFGANTFRCVMAVLMCYSLVVIMYYTSQRNLMPGKEFGSARLANVKQVCKILQDKDIGYNRVLSQNVKMSLDTRYTKLNNNVLIIGGSGAGKTFYEVKPNLMQMPRNCSFVITDPKGELLRSCAGMLKKNGYNVKVLNLLEMDKSDCYNPFNYIREETDVVKLITNLIKNTTPKGSNPPDPFWERAESLLLQAIFYYVWMEVKPEKRNFETVLKLIGEAKVSEKGEPSRLDLRMKYLEETHPLKDNHPAVKQYNKCMRGAGDTVRSIIISVNARLAFLENKQVLRMLSRDDMNIPELGIGVNGDGQTKTALFCVIPDSDKSYNFIVGMLYSQIFQELYYQADFNCGGRLPIHVSFMMDEFCNVALPDDFCSLLSTMRSREISCVIIIQNMAQIKALFEDTWETIPGNCDSLIFLGGNEQGTHDYISKLLGKATIDKRSSGETRGRQGSASRNYDVVGREILTPDEVRKLDNKKCLIFIRGFDPIMDNKFNPFQHPAFSQTEDGGAPSYVHYGGVKKLIEKEEGSEAVGMYKKDSVLKSDSKGASKSGGDSDSDSGSGSGFATDSGNNPFVKSFEILTPASLKYFTNMSEKGENVYIDSLKYEELALLSEMELNRHIMDINEKEAREQMYKEIESSIEYENPDTVEEYVEDMDELFGETELKSDLKEDGGKEKGSEDISLNNSIEMNSNINKKYVSEAREKIRTIFDTDVGAELYDPDDYRLSEEDMEMPEVDTSGLPPLNGEDSIIIRMTSWKYSKEQIDMLNKAYKLKIPMNKIMEFFYPNYPADDMGRIITAYKK